MSPETPPCYQDEIKDCFKTMSGRVYTTLRRLTQGDQQLSEDLVQETFQMACRNWQDLRELTEEERAGWLTRVAINTAIDVFRARAGGLPCSVSGALDPRSTRGGGRSIWR